MIRKILMGLAAVVGFTTAATAATATVVWEGDFDTTSKIGSDGLTYTLDLQGNSFADGVVTIDQTVGATITPSARDYGKVSVLIKYSDLAAIDGKKPVLATAYNSVYEIGLAPHTAGGLDLNGFYDNASTRYGLNQNSGNDNTDTLVSVLAGSGYYMFTQSRSAGTTGYAGKTLDAMENVGKSTKLKWDNNNLGTVAIGGTRVVRSNYPSWTGVKIEKVALFYGSELTAADVANYQWPSEAKLSKMYSNRLSTGGEQVPAATYGAITVEGDGYKATKITSQTNLPMSGSGEEVDGSLQAVIGPATDTATHTVAGWFRCDGLAGDKLLWVALADNSDHGGYKVLVDANGAINIGKCKGTGNNDWYDGTPLKSADGVIKADTWYHIAVAVTKASGARKATAKVFVNGELIEFPVGTFNTNLNGKSKCISFALGGGISAAGVYVDNNAIPFSRPDLVVEAATTYVAPYVAAVPFEYALDTSKDWSAVKAEILEAASLDEFPENSQITITATGTPTLTFDTTEALTGGLAFLKIEGECNIAYPEDEYEDGCWSKTLFTAPLIEATDATGVLKDGFNGGWTFGPTEIAIRAQNKEVISINIAGGAAGGTGAASPTENLVSGTDFYGIAPTVGDSWNNINRQWQDGGNQTITIEKPLAYDGETTIQRPTMSLSATGKNTWQCGSISNPFLRGYLDDGNGVTVVVHGVPYTKYDVIVYTTSDSAIRLAPVTINGTMYTFNDEGQLIEGNAVWGVGQYPTPEIGKNAIRINDCTGEQLTVNAVRHSSPDGRATICAVQVINQGEIEVKRDYYGEMSGDVVWTDGKTAGNLTQLGDDWENGPLNTITITNTAEDATFSFGAQTEGMQIKFVGEGALTLDAKSMAQYGKLGIYDFTEVTGGVTIELPEGEAFDPSTLPTTIKGNWKFSEGGILVFDGNDNFPNSTYQTLFQNPDAWNGTVWIKNAYIKNNTTLKSCGNSNSIVRVTGVYGWMNNGDQGVTTLELMDEGETIALEITDSSSGYVYNYEKFIGDGTFKFATIAESAAGVSIADVSEFEGKLLSTAGTKKQGEGEPTTPRPIYVGGPATAGTTSLISVADGAAINADCEWEAESAKFGATLMLMSGAEGGSIIEGLEMEDPVYLATKVLYPEESNPDFSCLGYEDGEIYIRKAAEFLIDPGENATVTTVLGAFKEGDSYYAANEAPVQVTFTAKEGYLFPNGSTTLTVDAEAGEGATIEPTDEPVQAEAKIGTTYYLTLAAALDAAKDKDVITLLKNVTFAPNGKYTLDKTIYLTLGGFNLTGNGGTTFEVVNGASLYVTATDSIVTALRINVGRATNDNGNLFINGGTWTIDNNAIIHVNGTCKNCWVTTQEADFTSNGDNAIQFCGAGTFSIDDGTITGATAVYVKAGTLSISADLVADGEKKPYVYSANGANATGDALVIDNCGYPEGPANVSLLAGTTLTSANAEKMGYYVYNSSPEGTVTKDATVDVNAPEGYLWKDGTTLTKAEAKIGTTYYLTLQDALNVGGDVVMLTNITKTVEVPAGKTVNLDFNGYEITTTSGQAIDNYGTLTIANGNITSKEAAIVLWGNSTTTISGGAYTAIDNGVIMGSGNDGEGNVTLTITGGTFNGGIESAGYIACGIYVPNGGTYAISGGQFNITGGCGICARAGEIKVASEATFNLGGSTEPGKVGDCTNLVPCVSMYIDYGAGYPGHAETDYLKAKDNTLSTADTQTWVGPDGEGYYTLKVKTGPEPAPGSPTEVDPVPGEENTYVVTPTGTATDLAVSGAKSGDTFIINGTSVTSLTLDEKTDVTVKVMNGNGNVDITGAVYGWKEPKLTLKTSSANELYKFSTELDPEQVGLALNGITVGANVDVAVKSFVGLTYTLVRSETIGGTETVVTGSAQVATETTTTLSDTDKLAGQAFYKVKVTK